VAIATPVSTHFDLARTAIEAGKDVLIEKPLTASSKQARELVDLAERLGRILMVGHTYEYNPAVEHLRNLILHGELGTVYYANATRVNLAYSRKISTSSGPGAPRHLDPDLCAWADAHSRQRQGRAYVQRGIQDVAYMNLDFPTASWPTYR